MVIEDITEVPLVRITLFCDVMQTFGLTDFSGQAIGGPIGFLEMSVKNYHYTLRNIPQQCRSQTLYCPTNAHNVKNVELLKLSRIKEAAPTCFGLQGNQHQGATASTWLKLHTWFNVNT